MLKKMFFLTIFSIGVVGTALGQHWLSNSPSTVLGVLSGSLNIVILIVSLITCFGTYHVYKQ